MPISMFLKAKLSSIPGGVASLSTPVLDQLSEKLPPSCLRSTTHRGDSSRTHRAPLKGPSQMVYGSCVVRVEFKVLALSLSPSLSLSLWRKVGLPSTLGLYIWTIWSFSDRLFLPLSLFSFALVMSMAPKRKSALSQNPLRSTASTSSFNPTPSSIRFRDEDARKDFWENFSRRGVHSKHRVILEDFANTDLPDVIHSRVGSHCVTS